MLQPNDIAPGFSLVTGTGATIRLKDLRGKIVVLYFYPKDDTPGCTIEACEFRDAVPDFDACNAIVLGISPDDQASHAKFVKKFGLTFPLLVDTDHAVADAYGVWVAKINFGLKYFGVERATFIIGRDGRLAHVYRKVKATGHAHVVRDAVAALG
jgi:peroxiredoxin Q/BCP